MSNNTRVLNLTRGFSLKHSQAVKAVENCACAWVEFGVSVRDLSVREAIAARNLQAQNREPLPMAEIPGIIYRPRPGGEAAFGEEILRAAEANQFARQVATA